MIKSTRMREKFNPMEKLPLNQAAQEIGVIFTQTPNIDLEEKVKTPYGTFFRMGKPRARQDVSLAYRHKKNMFAGAIQEQQVVVSHCSGEIYGQDKTYFRRVYENTRDILGGQKVQFTDRKITPSLLGHDDETMTLIIEKIPRDLSFYLASSDEKEIRRVTKRAIDLMKHTWEKSKEKSDQLPRYVSAFLEPEYPFLKGKKPEDYLKDPKVIKFYKQAQTELREFIESNYESGFGFGDISPSNLVEDDEGNILFIDVGKPGFYHWLTMLGQFYQATTERAPNSFFSRILKEEITQVVNADLQPILTVQLFALGRINRLLMGCTLRNIIFTDEVGQPIDEKRIRGTLSVVRHLIKISSIEEAIKYASDEFDSNWRERLKDYPQAPEYENNLELLKKEIDKTLPKEKPERKLVFVFMGMAGSGKSAVAQIIKDIYPSVVLSSCWIYFDKLKDQIEDDYYKAYAYQEKLAKIYLGQGYSVVMDDNNRTVKNRTEVYQWARESGAEPVLIKINVDIETATDRRSLKGGEIISREENLEGMTIFVFQMEEPTAEEKKSVSIIKVDGNKPLKTIKKHLEKEIKSLR